MKTFAGFVSLFEYDAISNRKLLDFLASCPDPSPRALAVAAHLCAAHEMWLSRLEKGMDAPPPALWPEPKSVEKTKESFAEVARRLNVWLAGADDAALAAPVSYRNMKGEPVTKRTHDILTSALLHAAYHRGQIALLAGKGEMQAPFTDYIFSAPDA